MIEFLFIDLDDTILDFHKAEHVALGKTLSFFGLEPNESVLARYSQINKEHWELLLVSRFEQLFREFGLSVEAVLCARTYEKNLSTGHYFLPGAREAVERLSQKYRLYLASNGTSHVQAGRLESANISHFFERIFISQEIGANKPDPVYFQRSFAQISDFDVQRAMIVGDSLTSDILGGKQVGMRTCWVNAAGKAHPEDIAPDYEIQILSQLECLLETIEK